MNKQIRNIVIVVLFSIGGGWLGIWLNSVTGNTAPPLESLGALVWLTSPALAGLFLRAFGGDGWQGAGLRLHLGTGWPWYVVAIVAYPALALLMFGVAWAVGAIDVGGFAAQGLGAYVKLAGLGIAGSAVKNLFEEFAWRGYLTERLAAVQTPALLNHALVAIISWAWHLPYYYYFLDAAILENYLTISVPLFLLMALVVLFPTALFFGELRLVSRSVWPPFLLHCVINGVSLPLILNGFISLNGVAGVVLTPTNEGLVMAALFGLIGWWLYQHRLQKAIPTPFTHQ
jgi:membrane protease YdiL (CAAX protease family)